MSTLGDLGNDKYIWVLHRAVFWHFLEEHRIVECLFYENAQNGLWYPKTNQSVTFFLLCCCGILHICLAGPIALLSIIIVLSWVKCRHRTENRTFIRYNFLALFEVILKCIVLPVAGVCISIGAVICMVAGALAVLNQFIFGILFAVDSTLGNVWINYFILACEALQIVLLKSAPTLNEYLKTNETRPWTGKPIACNLLFWVLIQSVLIVVNISVFGVDELPPVCFDECTKDLRNLLFTLVMSSMLVENVGMLVPICASLVHTGPSAKFFNFELLMVEYSLSVFDIWSFIFSGFFIHDQW